jgi:anti-sigma regulatory factor (Ser/Thr protein kinase)
MLPLLITCRKYQASGIDFSITLPSQPDGARLMQNTDWAHLIEPTKYESMVGANVRNMSATTFEGAREAHDAVDFAVRLIMRSISGLDRKRISAIEWSIAEIVDNVLNHSESPVGGIIQVMAYPRKRRIEIFVCDAGLTIPKTLRQFGRSYEDDIFALEDAIKEGVTKNEKTNKGNGLFGTFRCCEVSGGEFDIISGNCSLRYRSGSRYEAAYTNLRSSKIPFGGTYVRASINVDYQRLLENALIFKGIAHTPSFDIIEKRYETDDDSVIFRASEESSSFSTRDSGRQDSRHESDE